MFVSTIPVIHPLFLCFTITKTRTWLRLTRFNRNSSYIHQTIINLNNTFEKRLYTIFRILDSKTKKKKKKILFFYIYVLYIYTSYTIDKFQWDYVFHTSAVRSTTKIFSKKETKRKEKKSPKKTSNLFSTYFFVNSKKIDFELACNRDRHRRARNGPGGKNREACSTNLISTIITHSRLIRVVFYTTNQHCRGDVSRLGKNAKSTCRFSLSLLSWLFSCTRLIHTRRAIKPRKTR